MIRIFLFALVVIMVFVIASTSAYAQQIKAPLGLGNIAVKLDYINFTDEVLEDSDVDTGFFVGLEGYGEITPNLYLGAEIGYANPEGDVSGCVYDPFYGIVCGSAEIEVTYIPIELNLKYALEAAPNFIIDIGAGGSYNYVKEEATVSALGLSASADIDDWLLGGQFFIDLNYTMNQFFIGINTKYQLTEDFEDYDYNYSNWRIGGQIGIMF